MCIEDNPLTRALPYFIVAIGFFLMTVLFSSQKIIKRWKPKKKIIVRVVFGVIAILFFMLGIIEYMTRYKCL